MKLNRGGALQLYNSIISDFHSESIKIESAESCASLAIQRVALHGEAIVTGECAPDTLNVVTQPVNIRPIADPFDEVKPDFASVGPAVDGSITPQVPADGFFTKTNFIGAKGPTPNSDNWQWTGGWLTFPDN